MGRGIDPILLTSDTSLEASTGILRSRMRRNPAPQTKRRTREGGGTGPEGRAQVLRHARRPLEVLDPALPGWMGRHTTSASLHFHGPAFTYRFQGVALEVRAGARTNEFAERHGAPP
jgi:hypothetical protein